MTTIPAELFLLLTAENGRQEATMYRRQALVAAALTELVLRERVALGEGRGAKVEVLDATPTGLPELDLVLAGLEGRRSPRASRLLSERGLDVTTLVGDAFVETGEVQRKDGLFTTSWPAGSSRIEGELRARLAAVLQGQQAPSVQDAVLLELLKALRAGHRILREESGGLSRRKLDARVDALGVDVPAARALRAMIDALSATMAATGASSAAAAGS